MRPLEGIKVVEAAGYISAPFAGMALADLGADVVKVEPPRGETYRRFGPQFGDSSLVYKAVNQNKQGRVLDLKSPEGMEDFKQLLAHADIFLSNWRPAVAANLGLTDELIRSEFPKLIWVRVSGFGPTGPMADMPAFDSVIQSRSGLMRVDSDRPVVASSLLADKVSAMTAAQTATSALVMRQRTGDGVICDVAMSDAIAYFAGADLSAGHRALDGEVDERVWPQVKGAEPFATADGWITLSPMTGRHLRSCLAVTGFSGRWEGIRAGGAENIWPAIVALIADRLSHDTSLFWESTFLEAGVPAGAVMTLSEHMADRQTEHNDTYEIVDEPGVGRYRRLRYPAWFDGSRVQTAGLTSPGMPSD
jgi:crotonobetainyl-CoA:carnitine CoA-transferase CaiB-like acyl-CoA transferase